MIAFTATARNTPEAGFSLVETLVAITILLIVIVGPLSISSQTARSTSFASEQVIAFFLAQEGVELIRKGRDELLLQAFDTNTNVGWDTFINTSSGPFQTCFTANGCGVAFNTGQSGGLATPVACTGGRCPLFFDDSENSQLRSRYTHTQAGGYLSTPYSRTITLQRLTNDEVRVLSTVYWRTNDQRQEQSVTVESYVFNIYDR